jgi:predicted MPP superfamily phosphohydrolase
MFVAFLSVFLSLYGLLNWYAVWRVAGLFGLKRGWWTVVVALFLALSFVAAMLLTRSAVQPLAKAVYIAAVVWMGSVFILACVLLLQEVMRLFLTLAPRQWGIVVLCTAAVLVAIALVFGNILTVKEVSIASERIKEPVRIVHLTDIHLGMVHGDAHVERIVQRTRALEPDIVVITGDLFDGPGEYDVRTLQRFDTLGVPVVFVYGNHEWYTGEKTIDELLAQTRMTVLRNGSTTMKGITILGIDDSDDKSAAVGERERLAKTDGFTLLLYHRPSPWRDMTGVDLQLSGHTHAGQIFPFTLLVLLAERPVIGLHERVDSTGRTSRLYVSPGTGTWGPPMRLGSANQIAVINLGPAS